MHLEFTNPVKLMETNGVKILKNVKTCWISMLNLIQCVMVEYKTLLVKMTFDAPTNDKAQTNFDLFYDVQILLGLPVVFAINP
jgi:hypothetical protein